MRSDCSFTWILLSFACVYALLVLYLFYALIRLIRHTSWYERRPQKAFAICALIQCIGRLLYFSIWPTTSSHCNPSTDDSATDSIFLTILGTLPACFFLSSFSVNVYTFARIYHTVLMDGSSSSTKRTTIPPLPPSDSSIPPPSPRSTSIIISSPPPPRHSHLKFYFLQIFLCSVNLIVYALTCLAYISAPEDQHVAATASLWAVSIASFFVAGTFATYGLLLYTGVESRLERARYQQRRRQRNAAQNDHYQLLQEQMMQDGPSPLPFSSSSLALSIDPSTSSPNSFRAIPIRNPMRKLVIVSFICLLCFMVRTIMLPVLTEVFDGRYDWPYFLLYFICSEILPMCLILSIFDPPASSSSRSRPIPSSPAPAAITSTPQRAPPRASTRSAPRINVQQYDGDGDGDGNVTQRLFTVPSFHTPRASLNISQHGTPASQQPQQQTAPSVSLLPSSLSTSSTSLTSSFPLSDSPLDTRHRRSSSDETNDLLRQSLRNVLD